MAVLSRPLRYRTRAGIRAARRKVQNALRSVFFRTYVGIGTLILGALLATSTMLDRMDAQYYDKQVQLSLSYYATQLQASLAERDPALWRRTAEAEDCNGLCYAELMNERELVDFYPELLPRLSDDVWLSAPDDMLWWRIERIGDTDRFIYLEQGDLGYVEPSPLLHWFDTYLPLGLIFFIMALGMLFLALQISRPIRALTTVSEAFGKGYLKSSARTDIPAPLNTLAHSLNTMSMRLQRKISEQQVLIGAVPHELRTPLSRIRFAVDIAKERHSPEELRHQIEVIDNYVDDLEATIDDVIAITRLARAEPLRVERFDLGRLLNGLQTDFAVTHDIRIDVDAAGTIEVTGQAALIGRALHNVLDNAIRHARGVVRVQAWLASQRVCVQVDDDGPGIPAERREDVLMPFSRLDESRTPHEGGAGLGLALVDLVMCKHGGSTTVQRSILGGARIELVWACR